MTRLGVFDNVDTPQRFNMIKLLGVIVGCLGAGAAMWNVRRADGYGLTLNRLSEQLDSESTVRMTIEEVVALLPGLNEWLYWFDAVTQDGTVSFGLTDSSFMFVEGPPGVIEAVKSSFDETREVS